MAERKGGRDHPVTAMEHYMTEFDERWPDEAWRIHPEQAGSVARRK
jgi:hypothetical protein